MRMMTRAACALLLGAGPVRAQQAHDIRYQRPPAQNDGWLTGSADSLGIDPGRLAALTAAMRAWPELNVHAILIERSGRLVYEEYFEGVDERWGTPLGRITMNRERIHDLRSVTKSVISAL